MSVRLALPTITVRPRLATALGPPRSPLALVISGVALGTALQGLAYALGYFGVMGPVLWLFFAGLALTYFPCASALLAKSTPTSDRRRIVVVLGVALLAASLISSPLRPVGFDELVHETTLWQLPYAHGLFTTNSVLPVSPYYPGLELTTLGIKLLTGLSSVAAGDLTLALARFVLVGALYLFVSRLVRSERAGGIAVLVYVASPQFYAFNAAYSYQTLALAFAAAAVYFAFVAIDQEHPRFDAHAAIATGCLVCVSLTHHLVSWITMALFVVWAVMTWRRRYLEQLRVLGAITGAGLAFCLAWTAIAGHELQRYLIPIFAGAWDGLIGLVSGGGHRRLFYTASGNGTPWPQELLVVGSVLAFCVITVVALRSVVRDHSLRGGPLRYLPVLIAVGYPIILVSALTSSAAEVGQRASTFVFFGIATVTAAWLTVSRWQPRPRAGATVATVCFLGSVVLGAGPIWTAVPGPYAPAADSRSVNASAIVAADWAASHLPVNSTIAADTTNGAVMAAIGHLRPVTALDGSVNVAPLFLSSTLDSTDKGLLRAGHVRYLLVDSRLASRPAAISSDYEPDDAFPTERPTAADLAKFARLPGVAAVYHAGPITIYDVSALSGIGAAAATAPLSGLAASDGDPGIFVGACIIVVIALLARRRRGSLGLPNALAAACCALIVLIAVGLISVVAGFDTGPAALFWLALGGVAFILATPRGERRVGHDTVLPLSSSSPRAGLLAVLAVILASLAIALDLHAASDAWHAPGSSAARAPTAVLSAGRLAAPVPTQLTGPGASSAKGT